MNEVASIIRDAIRAEGVISFARFMEMALYCPVHGYYERGEQTLGRGGDYYTSVSVGSLFGELLGFQFAEWLAPPLSGGQAPAPGTAGRPPEAARIAEGGAHGGQLAADILNWLRQWRPELFARLEYWLIEPSARRREWQQRRLAEFGPAVRWVNELAALVPRCSGPSGSIQPGFRGVIFANELLDALPVRRLGWDAKQRAWFEWGVALKADGFAWARMDRGAEEIQGLLSGRAGDPARVSARPDWSWLPDGYTLEVCPAATAWWGQAASLLADGKLLTLDYGLSAEELLAPERPRGTLRAYHRQCQHQDVLARPGEQDLTAHVNFSALQAAGESAGLRTAALVSQEEFLTSIAARVWEGEAGFAEWTARWTRQFRTLTHPEHLGQRFRVLIQGR